jgi:hypothetical protein
MPERILSRRTNQLCLGIFVLALFTHAWLVTRNWTAGFMPGHEFRQAQTAIISYYIDRDDNFSLLYETPILGKPWVSLLLEVPVYEWSVVLLSRATGLPHYMAARGVSVTCFYLTLPAIYLLLARLGMSRPSRFLSLALVLACPVYIFYSRAFLMESMELMCCAWFLFGFVRLLDRQRWYWFVLTAIAGSGAALIKSATLAIWLLPAAGYGAWMLWRDLRAGRGWGPPLATAFWGLAGVGVPLGLLQLWMGVADSIKAVHASAWIFTSGNLSAGNWGLTDIAARFSGRTWGILFDRWREAIMPAWLVGAAVLTALILARGYRRRFVGVASIFFLAQLMFPFAYAYQDYYFYACAVFLVAAFGFALQALLESADRRWACWLLLPVLSLGQLHTYSRDYYPQQMVHSNGGFSFTEALREILPRETVIVVVGADWAAMIPLYSQHRALMVRNGLENDPAYLERAFADLEDEDVAALVLVHDQRGNRALIDRAAAAFDLENVPTFTSREAEVYCKNRYVASMKEGLRSRGYYGDIKVDHSRPQPPPLRGTFRVFPGLARAVFGGISPAPIRAAFTFGVADYFVDGAPALSAHPDTDMWLQAPHASSRIEWDYGLVADAYERKGDRTDGVEFAVEGIQPGGVRREIFRRKLDPVAQPGDRGRQHTDISYQPVQGEILHFTSRPGAGAAYDWAYWAKIDVK